MQGVNYNKAMFIISDKYEEIRVKILDDLNRGATAIPIKGMYKGVERNMIFVNLTEGKWSSSSSISGKSIKMLFLTVFDAYDIYGEGFKPFDE